MSRTGVERVGIWVLVGVATATSSTAALAGNPGIYELGETHVVASAPVTQAFDSFGGSTLSSELMETFHKETLDKALTIVPGTANAPTGNQRNETNVYVHGFDRWQVPLSVDGVRIYLPADNRLDFSRFLTYDVSEVQIAKSYVSVLDGPGGMGGAINLVTRTPTQPREGEIRIEADYGNDGAFDAFKAYVRAGARWDRYFIQASASLKDVEGWELSEKFEPTSVQGAGRRDWSATHDVGVNFKFGYTPGANEEYAISFSRQASEKDAPYNTDPVSSGSARYWTWPWWNVQTLALATRTGVGDDAYVKSRLYWETFDNSIDMYDDPAQTQQYSASNAQHSEYADYALGASVEMGKDFGTLDTLKAALFYRRDNHSEQNQYFVDQYQLNQATTKKSRTCMTSKTAYYECFEEPWQVDKEDTYSVALENTYHVVPTIDLVAGVSYDYRSIPQARDYVLGTYSGGKFFEPYWVDYDSTTSDAFNWQAAFIWRYAAASELFANISDRTRFPTLFELYSTRFGTAASNPSLQPERAVNYQIGHKTAFAPNSQISVSAYYANVEDLIQSVPTGAVYVDPISKRGSSVTQNQNVGDGYRYGLDLSVDYALMEKLSVGGNFSAIRSVVSNPTVPDFSLTGFPSVKGFLYAIYRPMESLSITPSVEVADASWTSKTIGTSTTYFKTGSYTLAYLAAEYRVNRIFSLSAGVNNLFDYNYTPVWGYPAQGRNYFLAAKATL